MFDNRSKLMGLIMYCEIIDFHFYKGGNFNSFIDGLIHRQMRKHLMGSFDKIYILDLHGNSKKKETAKDGSADQNVFYIMQGVSINIFVKKK